MENLIEILSDKMNDTELYKAIETLNKEKDEMRENLRLGSTVQNFVNLLKKKNFRKIVERFREKLVLKSANKTERRRDCLNEIVFTSSHNSENAKIAVYTCVVGKYDLVKPPLLTFENVDYFLFTDDPNTYSNLSFFQVKKISDDILSKGKIMANRYVKFHPKEMLGDKYDYSIYIDGNVRIVSDVRPFVDCTFNKTGIAMHKHRSRDCVYDEAEFCVKLHRGNKRNIRTLLGLYKQEGFPTNFGMNEANLIVADLRNETSGILLDEWWREFIRGMTMRDQLAWPYVLWKKGFCLDDVGCLGENIYKNYKVEIIRHE